MAQREIVVEISLKTTAMVRSGRTPAIVKVGRTEDEALKKAGITGATLTVPASMGPDPSFGGRFNEPVNFKQVLLQIERTADNSRLELL